MNSLAEQRSGGRQPPAEQMRIGPWMRLLRAPFFQAVAVPVILGTAIAWQQAGRFDLFLFLLALAGAVLINTGTNLANDYYDHRSGTDATNTEYTRFSGGSRVIQEGLISPRAVLAVSLTAFALAGAIGLYLVFGRTGGPHWTLVIIGMTGMLSGYFYTASPLSLGYRGWGELVAGLDCGPLVVLGAYYVQAERLDAGALVASLPVGILVAAILYVNQFSDHAADKAAGKANLVVRLGPEKAIRWVWLLFAGAYLVIILGCAFTLMPRPCLIAVATLPLAWRASRAARKQYAAGSGEKMIPAMAATVATHLLTGLLLACGYLLAGRG